jgi:hypothetical protein
MQLSQNDLNNLLSIMSTATICGMESLVIIDGVARALNPSKTCFLRSETAIPKFQQPIGFGRIKDLTSRIAAFGDKSAVQVTAKESRRNEIASLDLQSGKNKATYRCQSASLLAAECPKSVPDAANPAFKITMTADECKMVLGAVKVMGGKQVSILINNTEASIVVTDATNDQFTVSIERKAECLTSITSGASNYASDVFCQLIREISSATSTVIMQIGQKETLSLNIYGHTAILLPQINESEEE